MAIMPACGRLRQEDSHEFQAHTCTYMHVHTHTPVSLGAMGYTAVIPNTKYLHTEEAGSYVSVPALSQHCNISLEWTEELWVLNQLNHKAEQAEWLSRLRPPSLTT